MLTKLGPYAIEGELGHGAMGTVYRARHTGFGDIVAIKEIRPPDEWTDDDRTKYLKAFEREAKAGKRLDGHPNIVKTVDYFPDVPCIVMEYVEGSTLAQLLANRWQASADQLQSIWYQIASALDYAHSKGVIHRDVSARNIMLTADRTAKVCDFGIAKFLHPSTGVPIVTTAINEVRGTTRYMSPEQLQGHVLDGQTDQYSLAVLIHLAITGQWVFPADPESRLILQIITESPHLLPTLPRHAQQALRRALDKTPKERFASCTAFVTAFTDEQAAIERSDATTKLRRRPRKPPTDQRTADVALHPDVLERVAQLRNILVASATSGVPDEAQYSALRRSLLGDPLTKGLLPGIVEQSQTEKECLTQLIRSFPQQRERISFLNQAFQETIESAQGRARHPKNTAVSIVLETFDLAGVSRVWEKSLERCRLEDFAGAITSARTLLEAVCKGVLRESGTACADNETLPKLYGQVAKVLHLSPQQATDDELKRVLGGCQNIVSGLGALRNKLGDAHAADAPNRHQAELAVQVAGAMASFLVATMEDRTKRR